MHVGGSAAHKPAGRGSDHQGLPDTTAALPSAPSFPGSCSSVLPPHPPSQMEKLIDLAQELGLLPVSSSGSAGQPSWIPRLAGSPSPHPSLQLGAAQSAAPGRWEPPGGPTWASGSVAQRQPVWPQAWPQAAEKQLCRAAANLHALLNNGSQQDCAAMQGSEAAPLQHGHQQAKRLPQQAQQREQQQRHKRQDRHPPQQQQQQKHQSQQQQQQHTGPEQERRWQPSPQTPVDQRLPPPTGPPALNGAMMLQPAQRPLPPPPVLRSFESLPVPLPSPASLLASCPSEPLPPEHQPHKRPYRPQQQLRAAGTPQEEVPEPHSKHGRHTAFVQKHPPAQHRAHAEQHTPGPARRERQQSPHAPQQAPAQRAQQQQAHQKQQQQQQQQQEKQQKQKQKQQQQEKQQKKKQKQKRQEQQAEMQDEGSPSTHNAAGEEAGAARQLAATLLAKVWQQLLKEQATEVAAWQQEQRQLLLEAHEEQNKQVGGQQSACKRLAAQH